MYKEQESKGNIHKEIFFIGYLDPILEIDQARSTLSMLLLLLLLPILLLPKRIVVDAAI